MLRKSSKYCSQARSGMNGHPSEQSEITTLSDYDVVWYDNDNSL